MVSLIIEILPNINYVLILTRRNSEVYLDFPIHSNNYRFKRKMMEKFSPRSTEEEAETLNPQDRLRIGGDDTPNPY